MCLCVWMEEGHFTERLEDPQEKECLGEGVQGLRIEHYLLKSRSSQSVEVQRQVEHQRPQDISTPATVEGRP